MLKTIVLRLTILLIPLLFQPQCEAKIVIIHKQTKEVVFTINEDFFQGTPPIDSKATEIKNFIVAANPPDACRNLKPPPETYVSADHKPSPDKSKIEFKWTLLVESGGCSLNEKIKNAKSMGYFSMYLYGDSAQPHNIRTTDGFPVFFISKNEGTVLSQKYVHPKRYFTLALASSSKSKPLIEFREEHNQILNTVTQKSVQCLGYGLSMLAVHSLCILLIVGCVKILFDYVHPDIESLEDDLNSEGLAGEESQTCEQRQRAAGDNTTETGGPVNPQTPPISPRGEYRAPSTVEMLPRPTRSTFRSTLIQIRDTTNMPRTNLPHSLMQIRAISTATRASSEPPPRGDIGNVAPTSPAQGNLAPPPIRIASVADASSSSPLIQITGRANGFRANRNLHTIEIREMINVGRANGPLNPIQIREMANAAGAILAPTIQIRLPFIRWVPRDGQGREEICAICHVDFIVYEQLVLLPSCEHFFHRDCIAEWLRQKNNCPLCRNIVGGC